MTDAIHAPDVEGVAAPVPRRSFADIREPAVVAAWVGGSLGVIALVRLLFSGLPWALLVGAQQAAQQQQSPDLGGLIDVTAPSVADYVVSAGGEFVGSVLFTIVPFAVGVLVSLWLVLPLPPGRAFVPLVLRGLVAALLGGLLASVIRLIWATPADGFTDSTNLALAAFGSVVLAASYAPVVLLVLVVRTYVPRKQAA